MKKSERWASEKGFSMLELLVVLAIICVVASMGFMQLASARNRTRLDSSARELTGNMEKARADSIRRHAPAGQQASVTVINANSYRVVADYNNNGTIETGELRTFTLPEGVAFVLSPAPPVASFDWQGRLVDNMSYRLTNSAGSTNVNLTVSGDSTIAATANAAVALPTITATPYATPTPTPTPAATPTPVPPAGVGGCSIGLFPETITIRKNGNTAGLLDLAGSIYGDPGQATITFDSSQLRLTYGTNTQASSPQTFTVGPTTPVKFEVRDIKNTTAGYTAYVTVTSECGEYASAVTVTNN